jgi:hypothetical protein
VIPYWLTTFAFAEAVVASSVAWDVRRGALRRTLEMVGTLLSLACGAASR